MTGVETDQNTAGLGADILDGMAVPLRDIADIAWFSVSTRCQPWDPNRVTLIWPSMTYCHSSDVGCQWSSRNPPGSRSRITPVIVCEMGKRPAPTRHSRPPL